MADDDEEHKRPIIIKKIKKGGHGHHGGAWKVAYADFVTAMMAFFLLLWLLSSSSKATLDGIAEYFTPTIGIKDAKGIGIKGGGPGNFSATTPGVQVGQPSPGVTQSTATQAISESTEDGSLFSKAQNDISKAFESDPNLREFTDNILVEQSPEGLKIEIMDSDKYPLYQKGNAELTDSGQKILAKMLPIINKMPNFISITGHTDSSSETAGNPAYSIWELSADRANSARRYLLKIGMDKERTKKIVAMADKDLIDQNDPRSPKNRRVTIILLKESHMTNLGKQYLPADRDILSVKPSAPPAPAAPAAPQPKGQAPQAGGKLTE